MQQVSFEADIPTLEYEPKLEDILKGVMQQPDKRTSPPLHYLLTLSLSLSLSLSQEGEHRLATVDELDLRDVLEDAEEDLLLPSAFMDGPLRWRNILLQLIGSGGHWSILPSILV